MKMLVTNPAQRRRHAGMTLVEAAVAVLLVSLVIVGALQTVGAAALNRANNARRDRALLLAQDMLTEMQAKAFIDPEDPTTTTLAVDAGETASNRATFDDIDDYNGWTNSPPTDAGGTAVTGATNYRRTVTVQWVQSASPNTVTTSDTGVKRISVQIKYGSGVVLTLYALRTRAGAILLTN